MLISCFLFYKFAKVRNTIHLIIQINKKNLIKNEKNLYLLFYKKKKNLKNNLNIILKIRLRLRTAFGVVFDNLGLGICLGLVFGVAMQIATY